MNTLLTRVRSRLHHDTPDDGGDAHPFPDRARRWAPVGVAVVAVLATAVTVGIGLASDGNGERASAGTGGATSASTSETTVTTGADGPEAPTGPVPAGPEPADPPAPAPGAGTDLDGFFAAVDRVDQRLDDAADLYNERVGPDTVEVDDDVRDAIGSINPGEAEAAIPPGLPPDLLLKVLIVQDDLTTRASALGGAADEVDAGLMDAALNCLKNGSAKAARFDADVAAAKDLAGSSAPLVVAAPDSKAAGELALRLSVMHAHNGGCEGCGTEDSPVELAAITWHDRPAAGPGTVLEGTVDLGGGGIGFAATYTPGAGWEAVLNAC